MTSNRNAIIAYQRDRGLCRWCLHKRNQFNKGMKPHHIFGKRWDAPEYQITLCMVREDGSMGCHSRIHDKGDITRQDIVNLAIETIWDGEDKTPEDW